MAESIVDYYGERPFQIIVLMKGALFFFGKLRDHMTNIYKSKKIKNQVNDEYNNLTNFINGYKIFESEKLLRDIEYRCDEIRILFNLTGEFRRKRSVSY